MSRCISSIRAQQNWFSCCRDWLRSSYASISCCSAKISSMRASLSACECSSILQLSRLLMGRRVEADKKLFFNTIQDVRKLVGQHRGEYAKDVMGLNKHNTKGRRNKLHEQHQREKERAREEAIQYDSSMRLLNSSVMEIKREKDSFQKNQYKFEKVSSGKVGREKDGFLHISKQDLARIHGKDERNPRHNQNGKQRQKFGKKRFISKNKKFKNKRR